MKALAALGSLTEEAEARGDLRAVERLELVLRAFTEAIGTASVTERRRQVDRDSRRNRPKTPNRTNPQKSAESAEIGGEDSVRTRTTSTTTTTETHPPRAREDFPADLVAETEREEAIVIANVDAADWPDISAFVARRDYATWAGWYSEMRRLVGPASQFTSADLVRVCRDDRSLARPLGSPYALRKFLASAREERMSAAVDPVRPAASGRSGRGSAGVNPGAQQVANILGTAGGRRD